MRRLSFGLFAATMLLAPHTPRATIAADANAPAKNEMNRDWLKGLPEVTAPPESLFEKYREEEDRDVARKFYKKYIDVKGLAVVASGDVADEALQRTYYIVTHMLAGRPDILEAMEQARHAADHHRQRSGLHRHAGIPQQPESGISERARARHGRFRRHQLWRREPAEFAAGSL